MHDNVTYLYKLCLVYTHTCTCVYIHVCICMCVYSEMLIIYKIFAGRNFCASHPDVISSCFICFYVALFGLKFCTFVHVQNLIHAKKKATQYIFLLIFISVIPGDYYPYSVVAYLTFLI